MPASQWVLEGPDCETSGVEISSSLVRIVQYIIINLVDTELFFVNIFTVT